MVDVVDKVTRSRMMSGIRGRDTKPEKIVRSYLHRAGLRYKLNTKLIGKPDLVFPMYRTVVFVHGCFWHRHSSCRYASTPATNLKFWRVKFETNVERDKKVVAVLKKQRWRVLIIWACQLSDRRLAALRKRIMDA